jgi:hypothetical protein
VTHTPDVSRTTSSPHFTRIQPKLTSRSVLILNTAQSKWHLMLINRCFE